MAEKSDQKYRIGFDLGGTKMLALLIDAKHNIVGQIKKKTKGDSEQSGVDRIIALIEALLLETKTGIDRVECIGMGVPGWLDLDEGIVVEAVNLGWRDMPLAKIIEKKFGCPVVLANDVDAGVFGEYTLGAGRGGRCVVGVFPGTGIGGGCVYKGELFRGKQSCMEIGHIPMVPKGALCGCGRRGCLETVASRLAISSALAAAVFRGEAPELAKIAGTDLRDIRSSAIAQAIERGDAVVELIVKYAANWLGRGIAVAMNLLAPDIIVLGGGLVEAMPKLYIDEVKKTLDKYGLPPYVKSAKLVVAQLGDNATALGAACWAAAQIQERARN